MTINSLYIYDRHCTCVYYQDWHRTRRPKPAVEGTILPAVSQAISPQASVGAQRLLAGYTTPRSTLASTSGILVAVNDGTDKSPATLAESDTKSGLTFDEEAKLVYGVVLSLRNMIKKLSGGRDEQFVSYRTSSYKLHLYETPSNYKFVMLSDPNVDSLLFVLRHIYSGPFLEYVVKNPLVPLDSRQYGLDNEYLRASIDRLIKGLPTYAA